MKISPTLGSILLLGILYNSNPKFGDFVDRIYPIELKIKYGTDTA
jgi:hypothetical protein